MLAGWTKSDSRSFVHFLSSANSPHGNVADLSPGRANRVSVRPLIRQKETRAPSWTVRGLLPWPVILPKSALLWVVLGPPNVTRLGALDAEARISSLAFSWIGKFLRMARSSLTVQGLRR